MRWARERRSSRDERATLSGARLAGTRLADRRWRESSCSRRCRASPIAGSTNGGCTARSGWCSDCWRSSLLARALFRGRQFRGRHPKHCHRTNEAPPLTKAPPSSPRRVRSSTWIDSRGRTLATRASTAASIRWGELRPYLESRSNRVGGAMHESKIRVWFLEIDDDDRDAVYKVANCLTPRGGELAAEWARRDFADCYFTGGLGSVGRPCPDFSSSGR